MILVFDFGKAKLIKYLINKKMSMMHKDHKSTGFRFFRIAFLVSGRKFWVITLLLKTVTRWSKSVGTRNCVSKLGILFSRVWSIARVQSCWFPISLPFRVFDPRKKTVINTDAKQAGVQVKPGWALRLWNQSFQIS